MAGYRKLQSTERISVTTLLFPILFVFYCEWIFALFSQMTLTACKILFALALGFLALALSRITPFRPLNFLLQSVFLLACWLVPTGQFLYFELFGTYYTLTGEHDLLFFFSELPDLLSQNFVFSLLMLLPVLFLFTLHRTLLLNRRSLPGFVLGAGWLEAPGALLLAVILSFSGIVMSLCDDTGELSPARLLNAHFAPGESVRLFGTVPELLLDVKYNVLHIKGEDNVKYFVVQEGKEPVELESTPAPEIGGENS